MAETLEVLVDELFHVSEDDVVRLVTQNLRGGVPLCGDRRDILRPYNERVVIRQFSCTGSTSESQ